MKAGIAFLMYCTRIADNMITPFPLTPPATPFELAELRAEQPFNRGFEMTAEDERLLVELDHAAAELGFHGQSYFVEAGRAIIAPASFDADQDVPYFNFPGLTFEGQFATFSKVHVGRVIGGSSVRAVCLAFDTATLLPFFDPIEDGHLLHVPVLAVQSIEQTSSN